MAPLYFQKVYTFTSRYFINYEIVSEGSSQCTVTVSSAHNLAGMFNFESGDMQVSVMVYHSTNIRMSVDHTTLNKIMDSCDEYQDTAIQVVTDWIIGMNTIADVRDFLFPICFYTKSICVYQVLE